MNPNQRQFDFDEQGFVICREFQSSQQVAEINENISRIIRTVIPSMQGEHVFYENAANNNSLKQIQLLHEHDTYFGGLMTEGPFRALAEELLEQEVQCRNLQYFNKPPGIGLPTPAHQDGYYFNLNPQNALTMWLALEPVDNENGCVRYVSGSHKLGMRTHRKTGTLGFSQGIADFPNDHDVAMELAFPAEPGDLLVHHAMTIHWADRNNSPTRSRQALGFIYYGVDAKLDEKRWMRYQSDLKDTLNQ